MALNNACLLLLFYLYISPPVICQESSFSDALTEKIVDLVKSYFLEEPSKIVDEEYIEALADDIGEQVKEECLLDLVHEDEEELKKIIRDIIYTIASGVRTVPLSLQAY